jgi:hypothetical protein
LNFDKVQLRIEIVEFWIGALNQLFQTGTSNIYQGDKNSGHSPKIVYLFFIIKSCSIP